MTTTEAYILIWEKKEREKGIQETNRIFKKHDAEKTEESKEIVTGEPRKKAKTSQPPNPIRENEKEMQVEDKSTKRKRTDDMQENSKNKRQVLGRNQNLEDDGNVNIETGQNRQQQGRIVNANEAADDSVVEENKKMRLTKPRHLQYLKLL